VGGVADLGEWNPEPPTGGEAYTDLLCDVKPATKPPATDGVGRYTNAFIFF
jgi:hypothetical protein